VVIGVCSPLPYGISRNLSRYWFGESRQKAIAEFASFPVDVSSDPAEVMREIEILRTVKPLLQLEWAALCDGCRDIHVSGHPVAHANLLPDSPVNDLADENCFFARSVKAN
jgi:hypothetical protein